ncbi:MAG: CoA-disulfide reductase [Candidatus Cloacimonadales bacterium]|jgi:NADPH-dependent 2,4-dienoyl-CoA reductase/sulfur reductase-like enzyme/peroxiredoxin family protein/rhodanese-related sulfurtransferase/TusA-related sulfurtransferase|nr:CoA-disulfide reductase [Candidatus Cloacimonadota bacterium]MDD3501362.1 CoA-disulfide reductase [Candidatus Cloacimonadota bacterium]MDX9977547.1 CoA-disulfide reductase [Candidatus Cloacimonadales bacterium]
MKIVIVGGVAGGATTAARLRRIDEHAEIIMFERGEYISYANCGLPYYIGGVINDREKLFVQTPDTFRSKINVDVRVLSEVVKINRDRKSVLVRNIQTGEEYEETYDKLVLSPGAEPIKPPLPGIDKKGIFTLRNVPDTDKIKSYIDENNAKRAVIIGAGFIGLEMAENLHHIGMNVTIVEMAAQVMNMLDYEMAAQIHQHLKTKNVEFFLKDSVVSFSEDNGTLIVNLKSGKKIRTDLVILSIGVSPDSKLAIDANLEVGERKGIVVNDYMQTSDENIYALGDAVLFKHPLLNKPVITYLAGPANKQGRIVADNIIYGNKRKYKGAIASAIAKVFDITVASTGLSEKALKQENIPFISSITHGTSHSGYYPDALPLTLKLLFSPDGEKVYGAQIIGYEGIDKRIDIIATVLNDSGSIYDLQEIEHAYAPPFSSAKDPVNIAGFVAENIIKGLLKTVDWKYLLEADRENHFYLDIRTADEFALGSIDGSINIPLDDIRSRLDEIPKDKKIITLCSVGLRGYLAARILMQNGYEEVYNLSGGYKTYEYSTQKQSNEDIFEKNYITKDDMILQANPAHMRQDRETKTINIDACGLQCPGPIMKLKNEIDKINEGDVLVITASDPGFTKDVGSWTNITGNKLLGIKHEKGKIIAEIMKEEQKAKTGSQVQGDNKTIIVFSDDMDKALASFVIAHGAASTGKKVTMFFTFWGLNVIKKVQKPKVKKDFMGKMFSMMLPAHNGKLNLSKLNMMGMGSIMMKKRMASQKIDSLESMVKAAADVGIQMIACQMSMDVMGVKEEELLDNVIIGGVASYLEEAEKSNLNLFI